MDSLPRNHFKAILADPPWHWKSWGKYRGERDSLAPRGGRDVQNHYSVLETNEIHSLPISELCTTNAVLFLWATWPMLPEAMTTISAWGFEYKTCAFNWTKAHAGQLEMFQDDIEPYMGLGYWTRANTEPCLLATRGNPKRLNADVRQAIIAPKREHSRKPDGIYDRIERLVEGPYLELFARTERKGWISWGLEVGKFRQPVSMNDGTMDPLL